MTRQIQPRDVETPKAQAAAHYADVGEQIAELQLSIADRTANIEAMRDAIRTQRGAIADERARIGRLKRRRRVFARARFELEQLDEDQ